MRLSILLILNSCLKPLTAVAPYYCLTFCKNFPLPKKLGAFLPLETDDESGEYDYNSSGRLSDDEPQCDLNLDFRDPDSDIVLYLEGLPILGFAIAISHDCSDDKVRASRAVAECTCQTVLATYCWIGAKVGLSLGSVGGPLLSTSGLIVGSILG
jgi:hypothetical protein